MKSKFTLTLILIFFLSIFSSAQTVSGTPGTTGCLGGGTITASNNAGWASPQYQLLKNNVVIAPIPNDPAQFTTNPLFEALSTGTYTLKGRNTSTGTIFTSANIAVSDGYTPMSIATPTKVASCSGGSAVLTTTVTGGKLPITYKIALQSSPGSIIQDSGAVSASTFAFNAQPAGSYIVSATDACGQTVTGSTAVTNPTVTVNDFKLGIGYAYPKHQTSSCSSPIIIMVEAGFQYISNSTVISAADAALFRWKIKFQGQLYGIGTDGNAAVGADGISPQTISFKMPLAATREDIYADINNMRVVLMDQCGNTKEFPIRHVYNGGTITTSNCGGTGLLSVRANLLTCLPMDMVFTNTADPSDVITQTLSSIPATLSGFTAGATYNFTYIDAAGNTTGNFLGNPSSQINIPAEPSFTPSQFLSAVQPNLNVLGYGLLILSNTPYQIGDVLTYTVTASSNPLVPLGTTGSVTLNSTGNATLPRVNPTDPVGYWPKGNYTLSITGPCGTKSMNAVVQGYVATLSAGTMTPVCGGFNYTMKGNFDVASAYQVIIVSGPSNVGQVRDLASTTASLPFNGLNYGTYVFGLRIKGGNTNVLTETITYDASNTVKVDRSNTGGFVCSDGAADGILTISATSISPAPNNELSYALSTDGGATYGAFQSSNQFTALSKGTYYFKVQDGCGNVVTQSAQIGVASAPTASANGLNNPTLCKLNSGTIQLDVDISGAASYLWTGPGINSGNQNLKSPAVSYTDLSAGVNNYTCAVTVGAPCNTTNTAGLVITLNPLPTLVINNPAAVCSPSTVNLTDAAVTAGSTAGVTFTYFTDSAGTVALANSEAVAASGTYYIKATNAEGCSAIQPVTVTVNPVPTVVTTAPPKVCAGTPVDLTASSVTAGSTAGLTYTYFTDAAGTSVLDTPSAVTAGGTYYIKGTTASGCSAIKAVAVSFNPSPTVVTAAPPAVCSGTSVNLTAPSVTAGSTANLTFTYFTDAAATAVLASPSAVTTSGTYYIKGTTAAGCSAIQGVAVTINPTPTLVTNAPAAVCSGTSVDLTAPAVTAGSTPNLTFAYFTDAAGTIALGAPGAVTAGGTYYIKGTTAAGCSAIKAVTVSVNPIPVLAITDPDPVCAGTAVDLTLPAVTAGSSANLTFTYFTDAAGANALANPAAVTIPGTYYIKGTDTVAGCDSAIKPVAVSNLAPADTSLTYPGGPFCGSGTVLPDLIVTWSAPPDPVLRRHRLTGSNLLGASHAFTFTSTAGLVINPNSGEIDLAASTPGTYTVNVVASYSFAPCPSSAAATITINPLPTVAITNPAAVCSPAAVDLTSAAVTAGSTPSLTYSYFSDAAGTQPLADATAVTASDTYYIKGTDPATGCSSISPVAVEVNLQPDASFTYDAINNANDEYTFTPISAATDITYSWDFGDGGTSSAAVPTHQYDLQGTYIITLTATNLNGCTDVTTETIFISKNPNVTADISVFPANECLIGNAFEFTSASIIASGYSLTGLIWDFGDGTPVSTALNPIHNYTAAGTYVVNLQATVSNGVNTFSDNATSSVLVIATPAVTITNPLAVCSGTPIDLTAPAITSGSTSNLTFAYFTDAAGTVALANPDAVTATGTYYIKGTTPEGCSAISPVQVTINPLPVVTINNPPAVCEGTTVDITAAAVTSGSTANLAYSYFIDQDGTQTLDGADAITTSGIFYIKGTTPEGCSSISPVQVTVTPTPFVVVNSPSAVCAGTAVDLTAPDITAGSTSGLSFAYFSDVAATQPLVNANAVTASGTYYIQGTTPGGCSAITPVQVTINPAPSLVIDNPPAVCSDTVDLTALSVTAGSTANLSFTYFTDVAGTIVLDDADTVTASGIYYIKATTSEGCSAIGPVTVTIDPTPTVTITPPPAECSGVPVDLTAASVTAGSTPNLTFAYFTDAAGTAAFANPDAVTAGGTYYIKGTTPEGCSAISPVLVTINPIPVVSVTDPAPVCEGTIVDITVAEVTAGSTPNLTFTYFTDAAGTVALDNAEGVTTSGIYYIKGTTPEGCSAIQPVTVTVYPTPIVVTSDPSAVCSGTTVDLTAPSVTAGSTANLTFTYFTDAEATTVLVSPEAVAEGGTYYIKGTTPEGCSAMQYVVVTIDPIPSVNITNPPAVCSGIPVDLTEPTVTTGSTPNLTFTYFTDAAGSVVLSNPASVTTEGTYYIKGTTPEGCYAISPVHVTINPIPTVTVTNPPAVCSGTSVDLTAASITAGSTSGLAFTYFSDSAATTLLSNPSSVTAGGTYYIQGTTPQGCSAIQSVAVTVYPTPVVTITNPAAVCSGTSVDLTLPAITSGSTANLTFAYFSDAAGTQPLANANAITASGTYYIKGTTAEGCSDTKPVQVTINPAPVLAITNPAAVCSGTAVDLTVPAVTSGSTANLTFAYFSDAAVTQPLANANAITASGTYYIKGTTAEGCSDTKPVQVTINPMPIVSITNPAAVCSGTSVDLTLPAIISGSTANLVYSYFSDAAGTQPLANANSITASDTYYIQGTDPATGCSSISPVNVVVNPQPDASFTYDAINNANDQYTFTPISAGTGISYSWDFGDGSTSSAAIPTHQYDVAGSYTVALTVSNGYGCTAAKSESISITKNPNVAADISVYPANECLVGNAFEFTSASTIAAGYSLTGLVWDFGDGTALSTDQAPTHSYAAAGTYVVSLQATVSNGVNTFSDNATSSVVVTPTPAVVITSPAAVCSGTTVDLTAAAVTAGSTADLTYAYFTDAAGTIALANADAVATGGTYYIKGTTAAGCSNMKPVQVIINPAPVLAITNPAAVCSGTSIDLTLPAITFGSTANLTFAYFSDAAGTQPLANANAITASGTYYIKGTTAEGCSDTKPVQVTINPAPIVSITNPAAVCSGTAVDLTVPAVTSGSTANLTFAYFSDATATTVLANANAVTSSGIYYIKGTTAEGCSDTKPVQVTINPMPIVSITNPAAVCSGTSVDLTLPAIISGSTANLVYSYFSDAAGTQPLANANSITASDTYYIQGTDPATGCSSISPVNVVVNPQPDASFTYDAINNANDQYTFTPISAGTGISYSWDFGDGSTSSAAIPTHQYDVAGSYTVALTVSNGYGCTAAKSESISITKNPNVAVDISVYPANECLVGNAFEFTSASTIAAGYSLTGLVWDFGDGTALSTDQAPTHSYAAAGTYVVSLQATVSNGVNTFSDNATSSVVVTPTPAVVITSPVAVCSGTTVDLTAAAVTAGSTADLTYAYFTDAAGTIALANADAVATGGTYYIKGTTAAGCSNMKPVQVTINPAPVLAITNPAAVCSGTSVDLTLPAITSGSTANLTFAYFSDAAGTQPLANANAITASGTYYIKGTTAEGCSDTKPVQVTINPAPIVSITNPAAVCSGTAVDLTVPAVTSGSTANLTFAYFSDATATTVLANANAVTSSGIYYIKGTTAEGCSAVKAVIVTINALPKEPIISLSGQASICAGNSTTISASGTGIFQWYKDGTAIIGAVNSSYVIAEASASDAGTYSAVVSNGICTSMQSNLITLNVDNCPAVFTLVKTVLDSDGDGKAQANEELTYRLTVKNTGSAKIAAVTIRDAVPANTIYVSGGTLTDGIVIFTATNLGVGMIQSFSFKVKTASDLKGLTTIANLATASADEGPEVPSKPEDPNNPGNPDPSCTNPAGCSTDLPTDNISGISLAKHGTYVDGNGNGKIDIGDRIEYSFTVMNIGSTILTNIIILDDNAAVAGGPLPSLAPDVADTSAFTAVHMVTQADLDRAVVYNLAKAIGKDPKGNDVTAISTDPLPCTACPADPLCPTCTITPLAAESGIAVIKKAVVIDENSNGFAEEGETIRYNFEVKNTGNTTLTNVFITDNLPAIVLSGSPITLAPQEINATNFSAVYVITRADIDAGSVTNQALAEGTAPSGEKVNALSDDENFVDDNPTVVDVVNCVIEVFNAVSPNGDGINDEFQIQGLECYPNNSVEIYNRWGVKVFETSGYGSNRNIFQGYSDARTTISRGDRLPDGTYFYTLKYQDETSNRTQEKSGYLYIKN
ncbi:PKD domain-containing protein [Flavobacterium sp. KACC 22761]|uniref:Ig-like domain-containing protein n=1 Tax=Flavobacterium sp. KACC 22761 TaxID=3092665 RepID=UPI002A753243|nr:PKD domain-containing protein [Flavobacterium sp. KACC 22761]WPO78213.1 PKD domain-containing protein [Flavobacterium sp. KACC 22761]